MANVTEHHCCKRHELFEPTYSKVGSNYKLKNAVFSYFYIFIFTLMSTQVIIQVHSLKYLFDIFTKINILSLDLQENILLSFC